MRLSESKDEIEQLYFREGKTYQEIADRYGKSREAVRQFLNRHWPERVPGREHRRAVRKSKPETPRERSTPPCTVCGDPVTRATGGRGQRKTCSPEHSALWSRARFLLDPELRERQRVSNARSILRYSSEHLPSAVRWATKVMNGEPVRSRAYAERDSAARRAYEEVLRIRAEKGYEP